MTNLAAPLQEGSEDNSTGFAHAALSTPSTIHQDENWSDLKPIAQTGHSSTHLINAEWFHLQLAGSCSHAQDTLTCKANRPNKLHFLVIGVSIFMHSASIRFAAVAIVVWLCLN
eukprot:5974490-Amphidinium_carterae.1